MTKALDALLVDGDPLDGRVEATMTALLRAVSIDGWVPHDVVAGHEVDFAFPAERLALEVDGWLTHAGRGAFERDRERDADLAAVGWQALRFTWRQVVRHPASVTRKIEAARAARGWVRAAAA